MAGYSIDLFREAAAWVVDPPDDTGRPGDDGSRGKGPWVTVAAFWSSSEAHLAQALLEREDIDSLLLDEHVVATAAWYAGAVGGIKLQVRPGDAATARELLQSVRPERTATCPSCGSTALHPAPRHAIIERLDEWTRGMFTALFGRPVRCAACDAMLRSR